MKFVFFILSLILMVGCAPVEFTQDASCGKFGNQECEITPAGLKHFDNTLKVELGQADILIVNDNSGSMSVEQSKMSDRFPDFIQSLSHINFRIAVTTTDVQSSKNPPNAVNQNGALQNGRLISFANGSKFLDPTMSNINQLFDGVIKRPETISCENSDFDSDSCPSPDERGIFAASLAVDRNESGFFRAGAHLAVIILSDEDERSRGGEISSFPLEERDQPENFVQNVKNRLGEDKSLSVHSIIVKPGDSSCLNQQNSQTRVRGFEGKTYKKLSDLTTAQGGTIGSICASDYGNELGKIGAAVVNAVNSIDLACVPVNDEFGVFVSPEPAGLSVTLDKAAKKLRFNQTLPAGATARVIYDCEK